MKSSLVNLKLFLFISATLLAQSCAHQSNRNSEPLALSELELKSLKELERLEMERPSDPSIKLALARHYWCRGKKALAIEHWQWLHHFATATKEDAAARDALQLIEENNEEELSQTQACDALK